MPTVTWDTAFEASPADTDEAKYGANKIRQLKVAISERLELEMNFKTGTQPLIKAGQAAVLYEGTTSQIAALTSVPAGAFAWDTSLNGFRRYSGTAWVAKQPIPAGTKMLFYADSAPIGWTIDNTVDDRLVYITKGSLVGGQVGGGVHSSGSWTISGFTGHTHTVPSHTHDLTLTGYGGNSVETDRLVRNAGATYGVTTSPATSATIVVDSGSTTITQDGTWRPSAYCCIICTKD